MSTAASDFIVVIPARYASTRLPGKPLADIAGKPMIIRVAERAAQSGAAQVVVATDHHAVLAACQSVGVQCLMTHAGHQSGTERLAEVVSLLALDDMRIVVNLQGDEPLIDPALIRAVAHGLAATPDAAIATAAHSIHHAEDFFSPNVVKVVTDQQGYAHYFSRAPIPYARDAFAVSHSVLPPGLPALRHIGLYAYRAAFLKKYSMLPPAPVEQFEALEQLRALHHGYRIAVTLWEAALPPGVDTPEDLEKVQILFN